jgi:hypothetical protein
MRIDLKWNEGCIVVPGKGSSSSLLTCTRASGRVWHPDDRVRTFIMNLSGETIHHEHVRRSDNADTTTLDHFYKPIIHHIQSYFMREGS